MEPELNHIKILIIKHIRCEISEQESEQLARWRSWEGNNDLFREITSDGFLLNEISAYHKMRLWINEHKQAILDKIITANRFSK